MPDFDINQQVHSRPGGTNADVNQRVIPRPGPSSKPTPEPRTGTVPTATPGLKEVRRIGGGGLPR